MIFQAVVSNKAHPEYGQATIPFPIPDSEYDQTIKLLEGLGIGSPTGQDCRVKFLDSKHPILNRLVAQSVNTDELDYLAKRMESFCSDEDAKFQAMAFKLGLSDIRDLINLTFCCQQATVIADFSNLEQAGKSHTLTIHGGSMSVEEFDQVDGLAAALELIQSGPGTVTPYGVVYDNGMELEQVYAGGPFPQYIYGDSVLTLGVPIQREPDGPMETAWFYLPAAEQQIVRTLRRVGVASQDALYYIEDSTLPSNVLEILEDSGDTISDLNRLCRVVCGLGSAEMEKLEAVVLMAQPTEMGEICHLAENLEQFSFASGVEPPGPNSQINELGYVAYHGSLTLEELMREDPAEQYQREMGGLAQ